MNPQLKRLSVLFIMLSLLLSAVLWSAGRAANAKVLPVAAGYPLDPTAFTSLGVSPVGTAGTYTIDASKDNAAPSLTGPGLAVPLLGVFHSPSMGATANDEIAVFTFDSINIPTGVTVQGERNANSRPIALLSQAGITIDGIINMSGEGGSHPSDEQTNIGGAGGAAGPGGGGGGGGGKGEGQAFHGIPIGSPGRGGVGFVRGNDGPFGSPYGAGGRGGSVETDGGGRGGIQPADGGGGAFGGDGGTAMFLSYTTVGGTAYGDLALRLQGGSGGGGKSGLDRSGAGGGGGGGAIELGAVSTILITGNVHANGGAGTGGGGGGAGGGIFTHGQIVTFSGAGGLSAGGGGTFGGGGGGGRVRIMANTITEGCVNVDGGPGNAPGSQGVYTTVGNVIPPPAASLAFSQQPTNTMSGVTINPAVTVRVLNGCGQLLTSSNASVTLALGRNPGGATLGGTLTVNAVNGLATFSNLTLNRASTGYTLVASSNGLTSATSSAFNITCQPITVSPATGALTAGTVGTSYAQQFTQMGGNGTITWSINPAVPGLSMDVTGKLSGTPTQPSNYSFTVTATDANQCPGSTNYTLTINCPTIDLTPTTLTGGTYGTAYPRTTLSPTSGTAPYNFTVSGLPNGMTAAKTSTNVTLSGTPTQTGNFTVRVDVMDAYGCTNGVSGRSFTLGIAKAPLTVTVNNAFRNQGAANPPLSGSVTGQKNGDVITASYSTTATFASASGNYPITATLSDPGNRLSNYQVTNTPGTLKVFNSCGISPVPFFATQGAVGGYWLYYQPLSASPVGNYTFSLFAGTLPPGLQIVNSFGQYTLQGAPTTRGTYTFTLLVKNTSSTCEAIHTYTIKIL